MNETPAALLPLDPALLYPLAVAPALAAIDADAAGLPALPNDHPQWQRDVVSMSARARAIVAQAVPAALRVFSYWDHRICEIAFGPRTLAVDPAGCYRLR
jgi:hypothetical protein